MLYCEVGISFQSTLIFQLNPNEDVIFILYAICRMIMLVPKIFKNVILVLYATCTIYAKKYKVSLKYGDIGKKNFPSLEVL